MQTLPISACVICYNEEENIERCLKSLIWCEEIVVVDSGSTDKTIEIARKYTNKIINKSWQGYRKQKQFALNQCNNNWVISLDSDEELDDEAIKAIKNLNINFSETEPKYAGYYISRIVYFMDKWWEKGGWYPEYRLRLMFKEKSAWEGIDPHDKAVVDGETKRIKNGHIRHYTYNNLSDQIQALNHHSTVASKNLFELGKKSNLRHLIVNPISRFIKFYFLKKGFLEGKSGFIIAVNEAHYVFLKYAKLWELQRKK